MNQKRRHSSSSSLDVELPPMVDIGVNLPPNSTQETTFSDMIGTVPNQNLVVGHASTLPPSRDDAVSTLQPDVSFIGELKKEPSKC